MEIYLRKFIGKLLEMKTETEMKNFLESVLTPKELDSIPKRLEIVRLLKQGLNQRKIAQKLKTGIATVTRGAHELKINHFKNVA